MTHTADRNHTTNPRNLNNPNTLQSSTITKPTTQNTRITDRIGEREPKTNPVRTRAGPCPTTNHGIIAEPRNPNNQPATREPDTRPPGPQPPEPMD